MRSHDFIVFVALMLASPAAAADCWGPGEQTRDLLRQEFRVRTPDGPKTAVAAYQAWARGEVCEVKIPSLGLIRRCEGRPYARKLIRTLSLRGSDGSTDELGKMEKSIPVAYKVERDGPCTDHAGPLTTAFFDKQLGNPEEFQRYIDEDRKQVRKIIGMMGDIDDASVGTR